MTRKGRDVKEDKDKSLKDQILVIAPHKGFVPSDIWLRCRKKLMTNTTFQNGRKARNTWLAGKIKCGKCGYALKTTHRTVSHWTRLLEAVSVLYQNS